VEAGDITLKYFDEGGFSGADSKEDGSPVTRADHEAEAFIHKALIEKTPDVPVIGEEAASRGECPETAGADYFWLVDALDGTRQFIEGNEEYTVNIALIHKGEPIMGVVYAPVIGELYAAHGEGTAIRWNEDKNKEKEITVREPVRQGLTVMVSRHSGATQQVEEFLSQYKVEKIIRRGSSLKICAIAAGKADIYPRFGETHEWDTAAAHAVLLGAGGLITDMDGNALTYGGKRKGWMNPEFVAKSPYLDPEED
jgi:3'(2'), 5'-bisphosphate nucleotidase